MLNVAPSPLLNPCRIEIRCEPSIEGKGELWSSHSDAGNVFKSMLPYEHKEIHFSDRAQLGPVTTAVNHKIRSPNFSLNQLRKFLKMIFNTYKLVVNISTSTVLEERPQYETIRDIT